MRTVRIARGDAGRGGIELELVLRACFFGWLLDLRMGGLDRAGQGLLEKR